MGLVACVAELVGLTERGRLVLAPTSSVFDDVNVVAFDVLIALDLIGHPHGAEFGFCEVGKLTIACVGFLNSFG